MPNRKPNQTMEKPTVKNVQSQVRFLRLALVASVGFPLLFVGDAFAQLAAPPAPAAAEATAERVIVTGSNIPTAEETGPNPVDTYRVEDIAKLGVRNFFLVHKFRGLEIGGTYGNTNAGASNEMGEWEAWIKAGTGDDKTDIVVIADFWERLNGLFSRDRNLSANGFQVPFGGFDNRSGNEPGRIGGFTGFRLVPTLFFSANSPPPHSALNKATSPFYVKPFGPPPINPTPGQGLLPGFESGGNYYGFNFASFTPALPPGDRQAYYASFTRDLCDKYLTVFADFKYARSYFDSSLAAVPFTPDPFKSPGTNAFFSPTGISVPIQNQFNPFTV